MFVENVFWAIEWTMAAMFPFPHTDCGIAMLQDAIVSISIFVD